MEIKITLDKEALAVLTRIADALEPKAVPASVKVAKSIGGTEEVINEEVKTEAPKAKRGRKPKVEEETFDTDSESEEQETDAFSLEEDEVKEKAVKKAAPEYTLMDLINALKNHKSRENAIKIMKSFDAKKPQDVEESDYPAIIAKLKK